MPMVIDEIDIDLNGEVAGPEQSAAPPQQVPLAPAEQELARAIALVRQRQERLRID